MSDSTPTKRPAKKAAARPRDKLTDALEPEKPAPNGDDEIFVIPPIIKRYRYMFRGGKILDVESAYRADSTDRELALGEALRRWGGKKDDWRIEGVTEIGIKWDGKP